MKFLIILIYPIIHFIVRSLLGLAISAVVFTFFTFVIKPFVINILDKIIKEYQHLNHVGGVVIQVINFLDFLQMLQAIILCVSFFLAVKSWQLALRAFGIKLG